MTPHFFCGSIKPALYDSNKGWNRHTFWYSSSWIIEDLKSNYGANASICDKSRLYIVRTHIKYASAERCMFEQYQTWGCLNSDYLVLLFSFAFRSDLVSLKTSICCMSKSFQRCGLKWDWRAYCSKILLKLCWPLKTYLLRV